MTNRRQYRYMIHFRGDMYAHDLYDVASIREARAAARKFWGYRRLPAHTMVWRVER